MMLQRSGESAFAMPEQLGFQQAFRDGAAVDGDERPFTPRTGFVYGARQQLLAGATLTLDEHTGIALRHQARSAQHIFHHQATTDDAGSPCIVLKGCRLSLRAAAQGQGFMHLLHQHLAVERLGEETENAILGGIDGIRNGAVCSQDDNWQQRVHTADLVEQGHTIHAFHAQVGDDQVGQEGDQDAQALLGALRCEHFETSRFQPERQ